MGWGCTLIFSYIRRLGPFWVHILSLFGFFFVLFFFFGGGGQKNEKFWGMKILWIYFWDHHKIGLNLGVISMHFRVFS